MCIFIGNPGIHPKHGEVYVGIHELTEYTSKCSLQGVMSIKCNGNKRTPCNLVVEVGSGSVLFSE